jgi:hypothetical protein
MKPITITTVGTRIELCSPFSYTVKERAKQMGGRWDASSGCWTFDVRDLFAVRAMLVEVFGTDDTDVVRETIQIRTKCEVTAEGTAIVLMGVELAVATGRDSGARLGDGVLIIEGHAGSGGSRQNWRTQLAAGTVLELRDLPSRTAARIRARLLDTEKPTKNFEFVATVAAPPSALAAERAAIVAQIAALQARLAEIDAAVQGA